MIPWPQLLMILGVLASHSLLVTFYWLQKRTAGDRFERIRLKNQVIAACVVSAVIFALTLDMVYEPARWQFGQLAAMIFGISAPTWMYAAFLAIAQAVQKLSDRYFSEKEHQSWFAGRFYRLEEDADHVEHWVLRPEYQPYVRTLSFLSICLLIASMLTLAFQQSLGIRLSPISYAIPVCSLMIVHTFALYLGGMPGAVREDRVEKHGFDGEKLNNYARAARHLKKTFADALLLDEPLRDYQDRQSSPERVLSRLEKSGDINEMSVAAYFRNEQRGHSVDPDYVRMSADLTAGRNVLVRNPFFQDLGPYLAYPLARSLGMQRKVLVVCSGHESTKFVRSWLEGILDSQSRFQEKWKVRELEDLVPECNVGVLRYSRLCDPDVLQKNRSFFEQTEYVLLLNPSQVLTTMQMPLNVLCGFLKSGPVHPVFCIIDRNLGQIKDTLSHVIKSPIHSDFAITAQAAHQKLMIWDAEADFGSMERFEKQTEYLGGGIELGAEAVSQQIPYVTWVAERRLPVADLQNYAALGYPAICRVMKVEPSQSALKEHLQVSSSLWELKQKEAAFLIVEDEYNNPFFMANSYGTRARKEVFLNILSENYLLRDYFCANETIFRTNENSIPSLVPNFSKTYRNLLLKLILQILVRPMSEEEILVELDLAGIDSDSPIETLQSLLSHYTFADPSLFIVEHRKKITVASKPEVEVTVRIDLDKFDEYFASTLKNVSYILEDEAIGDNILDSRLYSLILQSMLPGQFLSYEGKNYLIRRISPATGVVLQRASDQIDSRKTYRQIRQYFLPDFAALSPKRNESVNGFTFARYEIDFSVNTQGYLELNHRDDLARAIVHDLSKDPSAAGFGRRYRNKTVLMIRFPQVEQSVLYQIALLLQEIMPTVMPQGAPYLCVSARKPEGFSDAFYSVVPDTGPLDEQVLAVIEDSDLDLGLLDCFEQSFFDLLEIIQDYLQWNMDRLHPQADPLDFTVDHQEIFHYESLKKPEPMVEPDEPEEGDLVEETADEEAADEKAGDWTDSTQNPLNDPNSQRAAERKMEAEPEQKRKPEQKPNRKQQTVWFILIRSQTRRRLFRNSKSVEAMRLQPNRLKKQE